MAAVRVGGAHHQCLGRQPHAGERTLELVGNRREEVLLPTPQVGVEADRPGQDGHACEKDKQEEATLPGVAVDPRGRIVLKERDCPAADRGDSVFDP